MDSPRAAPQPPPPQSPWQSVLAALGAIAPQPAAQFALPGENLPPGIDPNALFGLLYPQFVPALRPDVEQRPWYPQLLGMPPPMPTAI